MKYFIYIPLLLIISFCIYVALVNRDSKNMTIRQKLLKAIYPAFIWFNKRSLKEKVIAKKPEVTSRVSFYSLNDTLINGRRFNFDQLKGKKVLLVNTASDCIFTRQYEELEALKDRFPENLVIIGFPSNDFNKQEKADNNSIESFCKKNYAVSFLLMEKSSVKKTGSQNKVYEWLTDSVQNGWNNKQPEWNFSKYLVNEEGELIHYFPPVISPLDSVVINAID